MAFQMFVSGEGLATVCTENHVGIRFEWSSTRKETVGYKKVATKEKVVGGGKDGTRRGIVVRRRRTNF